MRFMLRTFAAGALLAAAALPAFAQVVRLRGFVTDSATGAPLAQVRVVLSTSASPSRSTRTAYTADNGRFTIVVREPGPYRVVLTRVGYAPARIETVHVTVANDTLRVALAAIGVPVDPVVVSASRIEQTQLDAPASVSVIEREAVAANVRFSPLEQIRELPGVDFASKGLVQHTFEVRGPRSPIGGALMMLTDNRYAELPSVGLNISYLIPATREDIARIEVVRGPAAALYGPGAPRGVLHIITRSPFESRGGAVSFSAGTRSVAQATGRYASVVHPRLAMSLSADYFQGDDWRAVDSVEIRNRDAALSRGAAPDTLRVGVRDPFIRRAGGEARIDWRPGPETEIVTNSGIAEAMNLIDRTGLGGMQLRGWRLWYLQSRLQRGRLMVNAVFNANDADDSYFLRTGLPIVEQSRLGSVQLQHGTERSHVDLVYGLDVRATDPRTGGTVHGQYEDDDFLVETGAYAQASRALGTRWQLIAALRGDHHSRLDDLALTPRAGVVYKAGRTHAVRLTYNRAYNSPPPSDLFLDVRVGTLTGSVPYAVRNQSIPRGGFTFRRDCNGLCMRSPFATGAADGFLPADATVLWSEMIALLRQRGVDITDIPAPSGATVATTLARWNQATRVFDPVVATDVRDVEPPRRQLTDVLELGYKGVLRGGAAVTADLYATHVSRRYGSRTALTPNVFFDKASLAQYLAQFRGAAAAAQIANTLAQIPVGTVVPTQSATATDILQVTRPAPSYMIWGTDLSADVPLGTRASIFATYSWAKYDSLSNEASELSVTPTVPNHKASFALTHGRPATGVRSSLRIRAVGPFPSGAVGQRVAGYAVMDLSSAFRVPGTRALSLTAEVQNLFDHAHRETGGGAILGRLGILRTRLEF